jgi:class 3 adenylate cyclase/pimeloyl-ACP methyl ester carboxylesterase
VIDIPDVQYAKSGDLSIAYQVFGEGPIDIVYASGFISHRDLSWELPLFQDIYRRLAGIGRVIAFDKRGTGLSDRFLGFGAIEDRMDDIRAVMDAAGSKQAAIVAISESGPLAVAFAATYPERVRALALWGTYARVLRSDDYPEGLDPDAVKYILDLVEPEWGKGEVLGMFIGVSAGTDFMGRYERSAATPSGAAEILRHNVAIDVRAALSSVRAPVLVIQRTGDPMVQQPLGHYLAEHLEGARYVELPGDFHLNAVPGGEDDALDVIEEFLSGTRGASEADRVLKTVLFTDIVDSTATAARLGDRAWRSVLDAHTLAVEREVAAARGRLVKHTGDGFLACFDGPARAIRCGQAIVAGGRAQELNVRVGAHAGECEERGDDLAGMTVHIGARVESLAGPGEVLVTSTVRDLVVGSGLEFDDRGVHELKGVPGKWNLLAVQA